MKNGLLLINLGTPDSPDVFAVRKYLAEFLSDKHVIDLPAFLRYFLLYITILPFRPRQSARAYQAIWQAEGSPLLIHSRNLCHKLQERLGSNWEVRLGMRYGHPSLADALLALKECNSLVILPLYPQYSSAATGSALEKVLKCLATQASLPNLKIIRDFYQHPDFIKAQAALIKPVIQSHDYLLLSYHGIPERQLKQIGCQTSCQSVCPTIQTSNQSCYRAQCYATSLALAKELDLSEKQYTTAFQSRLGKNSWIKPYTDSTLPELAQQGIKRLAVCCPSFTADCLETLEEIGLRATQHWQQLGGEQLTLIPCVNDTELWLNGVINIITNNR